MPQSSVDEQTTNMEVDEIELVLRRFASSKNDRALSTLLDSIFTETAEEKVKHENNPKDVSEDKTEKD